ncbi:uncharacterized protein Dwil_GK21444 [Drosophila willistoni]|uniref:GK21444 n=1 Tax=Drosophila willistoni TaxID=7260 RepID=B4MQC6_DROWI|nr:lipopolysaccharide-induced tumor necrosis factor-alpha factor [Drosophila willistoni]EDW74315.1 uncharacterized protein Dwil_GK21444 [Drosophila willistoni]
MQYNQSSPIGGYIHGQQPPSYAQATNPQQAYPVVPPVVIIQHHTVTPVGPDASFITCPHCHVQKLTRVEYAPSGKTHCMAALLCMMGLWCFACLPYCVTSCMNAQHYCGNCNKFVGVYSGD